MQFKWKSLKLKQSGIVLLPVVLLFLFDYYLFSENIPLMLPYIWYALSSFVLGIALGITLAKKSFRLIPVFFGLLLLFIVTEKTTDILFNSEFDGFLFQVKFRLLYYTFLFGLVTGYLFMIRKWASQVYALCMGGIGLYMISKLDTLEASEILLMVSILILLIVWLVIINVTPALGVSYRRLISNGTSRIIGVLILLILILVFVGRRTTMNRDTVTDVDRSMGDSSILTREADGMVVNPKLKLGTNNSGQNQLLFVAYIDNFFDGNMTANPLYLSAYHFSKYDSLSQGFTVDSLAPDDDIFRPHLDQLPLYMTSVDSSIYLRESLYENKHQVTMTLYNKGMSPDEFFAPATSFSVKKVPLPVDYQSEYQSAYTTVSSVSDWNSAYFIYNPYDAPYELVQFQEKRTEFLNGKNDYSLVPSSFMRYYTHMPTGVDFVEIAELAKSIETNSNATSTMQKVLSVRNYFLSKNDAGENLFQYTNNPGEPGIPGTNKLKDFLFTTRKGYCAYFAGAALYLLRAMNVPSRLSVGFLTEDRSDKSPGWYWYYQNQAHAWIQVYFPDVGWIDFDMTIGNDQAREASQADGTPPLLPEQVDFVSIGKVKSVDTIRNSITVRSDYFSVFNKDWKNHPIDIAFDLKEAKIMVDSVSIGISQLHYLDSVVVVIDKADGLVTINQDTVALLSYLTSHVMKASSVMKIVHKEETVPNVNSESPNSISNWTWVQWLKLIVIVLIVYLSIPISIYFRYFLQELFSNNLKNQAFYNNKAVVYTLYLMGIERGDRTLNEFAEQVVDPMFGTNYLKFTKRYQMLKFSNNYHPSEEEQAYLKSYFNHNFLRVINSKLTLTQKFKTLIQSRKALQFILNYKNHE